MAPDPKCTAIASALKNKGVSYAQLAGKIGTSEQHVINICTGADKPTDEEFKAIGRALDISDVPHTGPHATA